MADVQPISLSEFTNMRGDAANYAGGGTAILPASRTADYIQAAAKTRADLNNYIADQQEKRLNGTLADAAKINTAGVMDNDLPAINAKYTDLMHELDANYGVLADPATNFQKAAEIKNKFASLNQDIMTSKQHNLLYNENRKEMLLHPEFNSDENQAMMNNYATTPMADRRDFLLKSPASFNPEPFQKAALASTEEVSSTDALSPDKNYIVTTSGKHYDLDSYVDNYKNYLSTTMINGKTGFDNFREMYDRMPVDPSSGVKPLFDDVLRASALAGLPKDTQVINMKANPVQVQANLLNDEDKRQKRQLDYEYWKAALEDKTNQLRIENENKALRPNEVKPIEAGEAKALAIYNVNHGNPLGDAFGQRAFGSDPDIATDNIKVTTGGGEIPGADGKPVSVPKVESTVPKVEFIGAEKKPDGRINVVLRDNNLDPKTGRIVHGKRYNMYYTQPQFEQQMNNMLGHKNAVLMNEGTTMFNRNRLKKNNPTWDDLNEYFGEPVADKPAPTTPPPSGITWK